MPIASRTPEGWPNRCPVCGADIRIDPSQPAGDAPCPQCGQLIWFDPDDSRQRLLELIAARLHLDLEAIDIDSPLSASGADSLDIVELVMELEEEFESDIPDAVPEEIRTVRDLIDWLIRSRRNPPQED
jgi:acyl carrier protein